MRLLSLFEMVQVDITSHYHYNIITLPNKNVKGGITKPRNDKHFWGKSGKESVAGLNTFSDFLVNCSVQNLSLSIYLSLGLESAECLPDSIQNFQHWSQSTLWWYLTMETVWETTSFTFLVLSENLGWTAMNLIQSFMFMLSLFFCLYITKLFRAGLHI